VEDLSTEGFVLRTRAFGESDVIAVLLTRNHGKVSGIARGARRSRKRFAGPALEPFSELMVRFARRPHSDLAFLHECRILRSHHRIADELASFAWGSYVCELTERMTPERDPAPDVYALFRTTVEALGAGTDAEASAHHFILGLLDCAGWGPDFERCGVCAQAIEGALRPILDVRGSGVICARHEAERSGRDPDDPEFRPSRRVITQPLLEYVRAARCAPSPAHGDARVRADATALLDRLIDLHLGKPLNSRRFLAEIRAAAVPRPI
jgi:DNA repair protein RecO (recombination protein O)